MTIFFYEILCLFGLILLSRNIKFKSKLAFGLPCIEMCEHFLIVLENSDSFTSFQLFIFGKIYQGMINFLISKTKKEYPYNITCL